MVTSSVASMESRNVSRAQLNGSSNLCWLPRQANWTSSVASILLLVLLGVLFPRLLELLLVTTARARRGRGLLGLPQLLAGRVERRVIRVVGVLRRGGGRRVVVLGRGLRVGAMPVVGVRVVCAVVSVSLPWGMMIEGQHTQSTCEHRTADQTGAGSHSHAAVPR